MIPPAAASDPMHCTNGSDYFTHDEEMIACVLILCGTAALVSDPEYVGPFTELFITDKAMIWYKMVSIFQVLDAWTYLKLYKTYFDGRMGYKLIYNHCLGTINIEHMADGAEKKLAQCTYTGGKINWTFDNYANFRKEQHNILDIIKEH